MIQSRDFKEFIALLNSNKVRYMVIGGYAVAYHGYPRYTGDIDFWIDIGRDNVLKVLRTIKEFGFASLDIKIEDLTDIDNVIQLGYPPNRIDLICGIEGINFDNAYNNSVTTDIDGESIRFISIDDLIIIKKISNRKQDMADIEKLEKIRMKKKSFNGNQN